jgi:asparagine synthase (glutamine-hydrolysing)
MCGIAGIARLEPRGVDTDVLRQMAWSLRHRGPDGFGVTADAHVGLAHARLSILDIAGGTQPMTTEDGAFAITYNGEVFNYRALRSELMSLGHSFRTHSDTEVVLRGYEQWGADLLQRLNGQFAFAIHDRVRQAVFLARDRFGILPLFLARQRGDLYFASEIKGLFATGEIAAEMDPLGIDQVFTFWAALPPRTPFRGIEALPPGCSATWREGRLTVQQYYAFDFANAQDEQADAVERLDDLMRSAVKLRLAADVPVGGYLSGGLDSSSVVSLASQSHPDQLRTFSVAFDDPHFDESPFQKAAAGHVRSAHAVQQISQGDIASVFPDVVRHAETPLLRTAAAPMLLLSRLTRQHGIKVALTGEGSDELFLGYDLFKDTLVRLFCHRQPQSVMRPRLFERLYPGEGDARRGDFWAKYFLSAGTPSDLLFSHVPRFQAASWIKGFFSYDFRVAVRDFDALNDLRGSLPTQFASWTPLARAAYLEMRTLLSPYLLSSQGDRMAMAFGVESRPPFLDHRVFEFAASLPERSRLSGLRDKVILRRWAKRLLPASLTQRPKQAYRAPDVPSFFGANAPEFVMDMLHAKAIESTGIFERRAVAGLVRRCQSGAALGTRESQALVGILSTQLWHHHFMSAPVARANAAAFATARSS